MKLQGIFSAITTPFGAAGNIYEAKVRHNVEKWNWTALAGYVVCGPAGEGAMLDAAEKIASFEMVARCAAPGRLLIAGAGAESVRETVCLANQAAEMGYQAALVRTPHYDRTFATRETQLLYYRAVADQSKIPLIISNEPQETGVDIPAEAVAALSEHPNIAALNEASGNIEKVMETIREARPGFQVLAGSAPSLWPSLAMGASGAVLAFASAAPYAAIAIWEAFRTRDEAAGRDWQNRIARAATLVSVKHGIPGLKYAMDLNGYYGGPPRLPLAPAGPQARAEIEEAFRDLKG